MTDKDIKPAEGVSVQNRRGQWVPAIPEPYHGTFGSAQCECGNKFRNYEQYRGHYALVHILAL